MTSEEIYEQLADIFPDAFLFLDEETGELLVSTGLYDAGNNFYDSLD